MNPHSLLLVIPEFQSHRGFHLKESSLKPYPSPNSKVPKAQRKWLFHLYAQAREQNLPPLTLGTILSVTVKIPDSCNPL